PPAPPWVRESAAGDSPMLKSGGGVAFTVKLKLTVWERLAEVPVTTTVMGPPGVAVGLADSVSVDTALPPEGGVGLGGAKDAVTPAGSPEAARLVAALKPSRLVTVTVRLPLPPWVTDSAPDDRDSVKSGNNAGLTVRPRLA